MSKRNYTNYSRREFQPEVEAAVENVVTEEVEATIVPEVLVDEATSQPMKSVEQKKPAPKVGMVSGCTRLNVRVKPNLHSLVVFVVDKGTELAIDFNASTEGWYKVCNAGGVEGFCMKDYVEIKA